jgi:hypothetical protein
LRNRTRFSSPWVGLWPMTSPVEKHFQGRTADTADLSTTLRSGRDDKGEGGVICNGGYVRTNHVIPTGT